MASIQSSQVILPSRLPLPQRQQLAQQLYQVHTAICDGPDLPVFSDTVIAPGARHSSLLLHRDGGRIVGYCAVHLFQRQLQTRPVKVLRMQAGLLPAYRGKNSNLPFLATRILRYWLYQPWQPMYFLGLILHPSSFLLLHKYSQRMWPAPEADTGNTLAPLASELIGSFGYRPVAADKPFIVDAGVITRDSPSELRYWQQCDKPAARYFVEQNPGSPQGHGLLAMAPLSAGFALRALLRFLKQRAARTAVAG